MERLQAQRCVVQGAQSLAPLHGVLRDPVPKQPPLERHARHQLAHHRRCLPTGTHEPAHVGRLDRREGPGSSQEAIDLRVSGLASHAEPFDSHVPTVQLALRDGAR